MSIYWKFGWNDDTHHIHELDWLIKVAVFLDINDFPRFEHSTCTFYIDPWLINSEQLESLQLSHSPEHYFYTVSADCGLDGNRQWNGSYFVSSLCRLWKFYKLWRVSLYLSKTTHQIIWLNVSCFKRNSWQTIPNGLCYNYLW